VVLRAFHGTDIGRRITRSFESDAEARTEFSRILSTVGLNWDRGPHYVAGQCGNGEYRSGFDDLDGAESSDDIISLDARFHETLYAPARRERTLSMIATLRLNFERYFRFAWEGASHLKRAQREHRQILKCCRERSGEKACTLLSKHILGAGTPLLRRLKELETTAGSNSVAR
jgi:FCD domain